MKKSIKTTLLITSLLGSSAIVQAADYGVTLNWNTTDADKVLSMMDEQRSAFGELIKNKEIKDMFLVESEIDGKLMGILRFVIEADNEKGVEDKLSYLPFYKENLVKIEHIQPLGGKWLDNTPSNKNYGLMFKWEADINVLEMDRVIGIDLQRVIALNKSGLVTSSYIDTQTVKDGSTRPTYSVSIMAKDEDHARELSQQFEAVSLGYAKVEVMYLGYKINMKAL
ncbi:MULTISPECIES: hypothetical protein [unclassified Aliivibrio]|uniref:hypothetical protein n=1 Tax=unclassified Aliivibrio TaxID=2645654 RepID=UPI00080E5F60|nr:MULTISPECIES: hypothetical protein [unclassified Aliivibrio]OCH17524.1 hypothetical protein A6E05_14710 [Aliivibrio sp. 1S165]OCH23420.1 hypothetical protein A6E03_07090 [Aliivibrio sp. 1S128]OCH34517.1 hypothetical protein A6E06_01450 [Aliivibrio sp. 1S175]